MLAHKTLIVAFLIPKFIPSDPKMIFTNLKILSGDASQILELPWQTFPVNEFLLTQEPIVLQ